MEFSKTFLFVLFTLLFVSFVCGGHGSANYDGSMTYHPSRVVPSGPNPTQSPQEPPSKASMDEDFESKLDGFTDHHHHPLRLVPSGPNPQVSPQPPPSKASTSFGSDSMSNASNNYHPLRLVPTGPNPTESPEEPPTDASALKGFQSNVDMARHHPKPRSRRLRVIPMAAKNIFVNQAMKAS